MKLKIQQITGQTPPDDERLILTVVAPVNLSEFMVVNTLRDAEGLKQKQNRQVYVFPSVQVTKGDKVVLYTGKGNDSRLTIENNNVRYSFYWGLSKRIWRRHIGDVYLARVKSWESKRL